MTRRTKTKIVPAHRLGCLKTERVQPVLLDIRLAYLPCKDSRRHTLAPATRPSGHCPVLRKAEDGCCMPGMRNMFNQQSYKTFTPEFVPSTDCVGRAPSPAAFDLEFLTVQQTSINFKIKINFKSSGRGRPLHTHVS